jgi:hypothetical protein
MGTTAEKLTHLSQTKSDIRDAIEAKGVSVPVETTFRDYATKVSDIKTDFSDTFNYAERVSQDGGSVENLSEVSNLDFNDGATLNFIPSGKKAGKSYSQVPTDGSGDWTVNRNCEATYIDKDGVRQTAQPNEPRYDWSSGSPVLLREEQSTNLIINSEDFTQTSWGKSGITITPSYGNSPLGENTSHLISIDRENRILQSNKINHILNEYYSGSVLIKGNAGETINIRVGSTEQLITLNGIWQLVKIENKIYNNSAIDYFNLNTFGGSTARVFELAYCHLEQNSKSTTYIKTESSTVTRLADIIETTPPAGTTQIIETIDGVEQTPITTIPATYQIPEGNINQIKML